MRGVFATRLQILVFLVGGGGANSPYVGYPHFTVFARQGQTRTVTPTTTIPHIPSTSEICGTRGGRCVVVRRRFSFSCQTAALNIPTSDQYQTVRHDRYQNQLELTTRTDPRTAWY
ncbi:hypothetical protein BJ165DRAFT_286858 [Panaeolus papilionaceus]|nr:hypothetical protein BJ165DRAFT_286858 [Panaeolus papilionaceus]